MKSAIKDRLSRSEAVVASFMVNIDVHCVSRYNLLTSITKSGLWRQCPNEALIRVFCEGRGKERKSVGLIRLGDSCLTKVKQLHRIVYSWHTQFGGTMMKILRLNGISRLLIRCRYDDLHVL